MNTKRVLAALAVMAILTSIPLRAMPQIGDLSPRFEAMDQNSNRIKLADYLGKKIVLLYFYPKDFTPGCTKEACGFRDRIPQLDQDHVVVIGVSFDTIETHFKFASQLGLKFSLIGDPAGRIAYAFGTKMKGTNLANRVSFLIDTDGRIVQIANSPDPEKHFQEMEAAIISLKKEIN